VWASLAATLLLTGDREEARRAAAIAIAIRVEKGDVAGAAALERGFADLGVEPGG
jgi:hypothetical protein